MGIKEKRAARLFFLLFPSKQLQSNGHALCRRRLHRVGCGREAIVIDSMGEPQRGYNHPQRANIKKRASQLFFYLFP